MFLFMCLQFVQGMVGMVYRCSVWHQLGRINEGLGHHFQDVSLTWLASRCWLSAESSTGTVGRGPQFLSMWDVPQAAGLLQARWLGSKSKCSMRHKMEAPIIYWSCSHRGQIQWQEREDPWPLYRRDVKDFESHVLKLPQKKRK